MKTLLIAALLCYSALCRAQSLDLPDNPRPNLPKPEVKFFTFRSPDDPPLRTNRQMFHSKTYVLSQLAGAAAMVAACRNKRSGESWGQEVPAVLAVDGLAYLGGRFFTMPFAVGPGVYEAIHYGIAAAK